MPDESSFIIEILLRAKDEASAKVAALQAQVEALKRSAGASSGRGGIAKPIDDLGKSAQDTTRHVDNTRLATERLHRSAGQSGVAEGAKDVDAFAESAKRAEAASKGATAATGDQRLATTRLGESIDTTSKKTDSGAKTLREHADAAEHAARSYELFDASVKRGTVTNDDARRGFSQYARELDSLARKFPAASEEALKFSKVASEARSRSGDFGVSSAEIERVKNAYATFNREVDAGGKKASEVRRGYQDLASELGAVGRSFRAGSKDAQEFLKMAEEAGKRAKKASYLAPGEWGWDTVLAKTAARLDDFGLKVVSLSANLRGVLIAGAAGIAQQLDTAVVGLAGGLVAVASAAAQAAAAVGGAFVSALSQAVPVVAVLGAAVERLKSVFQFVQLSQKVKEESIASPSKGAISQLQNASAVASAEHGLQSAYEGVAVAQQRVRSSQEQLTLARIDAIRNLTNLTLAEKDAKLQAEGANLSLIDSQRALQVAIQQGNTAGIQSAQLAVREAELAQTKAENQVPRAEVDAARAQRQGVNRNPQVVAAQQGAVQARRDLANQQFQIQQAKAQLELAKLQGSESGSGESASQKQLEALEKKLTVPEKRLAQSLVHIKEMLSSPSSPLAKLTDYIVSPVADGIARIEKLLSSSSALKPLRELAKSMGAAFREIGNALTGNKAVSFFDEMAMDAAKNVPLVADAFTHLLGFFQAIAKTAAPILHEALKAFDDFMGRLDKRENEPQGLARLRSFFEQANSYAKKFGDLAGAFYDFFKALGRDAAPSGGGLIDSLTNSLNSATTWIQTHGPEVRKFFRETAEVVRQIGELLFGVGLTMIKAFSPSSTAALQQFLTQILLPALTKLLNVLGWITTAFLNIAKAIPGGTATLQTLAGIVAGILLIGKVYEPLVKVVTVMKALVASVEALGLAMTGVGKWSAIWTSFSGTMKGVQASTEGAALAQEGLNAAEAAGAGVAGADAAAQSGVAAAEVGAGGAGAAAGGLGALGLVSRAVPIIGGAALAGASIVKGLNSDGKSRGLVSDVGGFFTGGLLGNASTSPVGLAKSIFGGDGPSKSEESLKKFNAQLAITHGSLSKLPKGELHKITQEALKLAEDPNLSKYRKQLEAVANEADPLVASNRRWTKKTQEYLAALGPVANEVAKSFSEMSVSSGDVVENLQNKLKTEIKTIADDLGTNSEAGKKALLAAFGSMVRGMEKAMADGHVATGVGMQKIGETVSEALKTYGINPSQINKYVAHVSSTVVRPNKAGGPVEYPTYKRADGGWMHARAGGMYHTAEGGHDEMALTTDPSKARRQSDLLGQFLSRAPHVKAYAEGGNVGGYEFPHHGREVSGRTDQGVDYNLPVGSPITAIGDAKVIGVIQNWFKGQPLIWYKLLQGAFKDRYVYVAEQINRLAKVGSTLKEGQPVAYYAPSGTGIEEGWATSSGATLARATSGYSEGQATAAGSSFRKFLTGLQHGKIVGGGAGGPELIQAPQVKGLSGSLGKIAQGALNKATNAANEYLQRVAGTVSETEGSPAPSGPLPKGNLNAWLTEALKITKHFTASNLRALYGRAMQESGGNPRSTNLTDSNAAAGHPSKGLLETIPETFNAYKLPGHGDVWNPVDNAIAAIRYMYARYGHIVGPGGGGYAAGGIPNAPWGGKPALVWAHEGERIVNPAQWHEAARLAGTSPSGLDHHMGYDGRPKQHFAPGGHVVASAVSAVPTFSEVPLDALSNTSYIAKVFKAVVDGFRALDKINTRSASFEKAFLPFIDEITNESTGVLARLTTAFSALRSRLSSGAAKKAFVAHGNLVTSTESPREETEVSLGNLAAERKNLEEQRGIIHTTAVEVKKRYKALAKLKQTKAVKAELQHTLAAYNKLIEARQSLEEEIAQNLQTGAQATQTRVQQMIEDANNTFGAELSTLQTQQGEAQTRGEFASLPKLDQQIANAAKNKIGVLQGALTAAQQSGDQTLVVQIKQEIEQLQATVTSAAAQAISDAEQAIQQQAGRYAGRASVKEAIASREAARGNFGADLGERRAGIQESLKSDTYQLHEYRELLNKARGEGNLGAVLSLEQTIKGLEVDVINNTQALQDNTASVTQAATAFTTREGSFTTGLMGGLAGIIQTIGSITGQTNVPGLAGLYKQSNTSLESTNQKLIGGPEGLNSFLAASGITGIPNLEGLTGEALVKALSGINWGQVLAPLDSEQRTTVEGIIDALVQNGEQIATNTKELAILNGQLAQPQTFSTALFKNFRDSIFTGAGGLLPSYAAAVGVAPALNPALTGAGYAETGNGDTIINNTVEVTTPMEVLDGVHVGQQIAWGMKTPK